MTGPEVNSIYKLTHRNVHFYHTDFRLHHPIDITVYEQGISLRNHYKFTLGKGCWQKRHVPKNVFLLDFLFFYAVIGYRNM